MKCCTLSAGNTAEKKPRKGKGRKKGKIVCTQKQKDLMPQICKKGKTRKPV